MKKSLFLFSFFLILVSCGHKSNDEAASGLLEQAQKCYDKGDYTTSQLLIDSLKKSFPEAISQRKEALFLSRKVLEGKTLQELSQADSLNVVYQIKVDSLSSLFRVVKGAQENFYLRKGLEPSDAYSHPGLQARMNPDGSLWMIVTAPGKAGSVKNITLSRGGKSASSGEIWREGPNVGSESVTISGTAANEIGKVAAEGANSTAALSFNGGNCISLSSKDINSIADTYELSNALRELKLTAIEKEKLNQKLMTIRAQQAKTFMEKDSTK